MSATPQRSAKIACNRQAAQRQIAGLATNRVHDAGEPIAVVFADAADLVLKIKACAVPFGQNAL